MPVRDAHSLFLETHGRAWRRRPAADPRVPRLRGRRGLSPWSDPLAPGRRWAPRWRSSPRASSRRRSTGPGSCPPASAWSCSPAGLLTGPATLGRRRPSAPTQAVNGRRARGLAPRPSIRARRGDAARRRGRDLGRRHPLPDRGQARRQPPGGERREPPAAAQDARDASTLQPWAAGPRLQLALVEELGGDLKPPIEDLGEAIHRAPDDWQLWFVRARLEVKSGDVDGARRALERARQLNPRAPFLSQ